MTIKGKIFIVISSGDEAYRLRPLGRTTKTIAIAVRSLNPDLFAQMIAQPNLQELLKMAWYRTHHHYAKEHTHLYVAEAMFKYNHRNTVKTFSRSSSEVALHKPKWVFIWEAGCQYLYFYV